MKKYNNTKTVIAVSNKSGILVYVVTALMICTSTIYFIVVGIAYVAAGIWMLENKYYSKVPYIIAAIGSIALIAFYVSTRTMNIPSIGLQDDIGTIDILSKVMQAAIAGISIYIVRYSTIIWRSATTMATKAQSSLSLPSLAAEILEQEVRKMQKRNENQKRTLLISGTSRPGMVLKRKSWK